MSTFWYMIGALLWVILGGGFLFLIFLYDIAANYLAAVVKNQKDQKAAQKHWDDMKS